LNPLLKFSRNSYYVELDATFLQGRNPALRQMISRSVTIAVGIMARGQQEVLGNEVGESEDETFWITFIPSLKERGLTGLGLANSDAPDVLKKSITSCFQGFNWKDCPDY